MKYLIPLPLVLALGFLPCREIRADVRLAGMFSDHMVLQRDAVVPVWGWAEAGEQVSVGIAGQEKKTVADAGGKWMVKLDPLKIGEPLDLVVTGKNTLILRDVLVGEVWLASGQSNMGFNLIEGRDAEQVVANSTDSRLRMLKVPATATLEVKEDFTATWQMAAPGTVPGWSAVGYFYGKYLREKLGVPVGIVVSSYGGTPAEAWTSIEVLNQDPEWKAAAAEEIQKARTLPADTAAFPGLIATWMKENGAEDPGNTGVDQGWANQDFDDSTWKEVVVPKPLAQLGMQAGGVVWFRKTFSLAATAGAKDLSIDINWITDAAATVYFNGTELAPPTSYTRYFHSQPRYKVPKELIRPSQPNVVALRLHALTRNSSWWQWTRKMGLPVADPAALGDTWKMQVEHTFAPLSDEVIAGIPKSPEARLQNTSSALYNAMIHPLIPFAIQGVIWYQGENNTNPPTKARPYRRLLPAMIADWRGRWGQGDFPFYIVQLANNGANPPQPGESGWAVLRESQSVVAATIPQTGLAVTIDIGESDNIHPKNKQDVGKRLALLALNRTYDKKVEDSGPVYASMKVEGSTIRLNFTHAESGLEAKGGPLKYFAIAGDDKKFVWAEARIEGDSIVVSNSKVANPVAVRYAWADSPEGCNLYSKQGLPASPFRTDAP